MKKNRNPLVVLCYHGLCDDPDQHLNDFCFMTVERFAQNLDDVANSGWTLIDLSEGLKRLQDGSLSAPSVALTFDDGFAQTLRLAESVLKARSACTTVFIPTELSRQSRTPWFTDVIQLVKSTAVENIQFFGHRLPAATTAEKSAANRIIQETLKELHPKAIQTILKDLSNSLSVKFNFDNSDYRIVNEQECEELLSQGTISFGAHSASHAIHTKLNPVEIEQEIAQSVRHIQRITHTDFCLYAYPNGRKSDFSKACKVLLEKHAVAAAFTTIEGWNCKPNDPYALRRFCVGQRTNVTAILRSPFWKVSSLIS